MAKCPVCKREVEEPVAKWNVGMMSYEEYECCGRRFHRYVRIEQELPENRFLP